MKEDLLHYAWRMKKFDWDNLLTSEGHPILIIDFGTMHKNAGPDFLNAKIKIGPTLWAGNVEMHLKSSDWYKHGHDKDKSYDTVVLHVVYEEDVPVFRQNGEKIPCLVLKNRITHPLKVKYQELIHNEKQIPCEGLLDNRRNMIWKMWLERLAVERLENKVRPIKTELENTVKNSEEVFYRCLMKGMGRPINTLPFEHLARSLPFKIINKHRYKLSELEALIFGQAGMLASEFKDEYLQHLKKEYLFLRAKYNLQPIHFSTWKFLRLRPANFPTIRLAQIAALLHRHERLLSQVASINNYSELEKLFHVEVSEYWKTHYIMEKPSVFKEKRLGRKTIQSLMINSIIPFLFQYGYETCNETLGEKAFGFLRQIPPEKNHIIRIWSDLGITPENASESQALLQLKHYYCDRKKCLNCPIGHSIVGKNLQSDTKKSEPMGLK